MKEEKMTADHTMDVTLKRVDELHHQVEELKAQLLTKGNRKKRRSGDSCRFYSNGTPSEAIGYSSRYFVDVSALSFFRPSPPNSGMLPKRNHSFRF